MTEFLQLHSPKKFHELLEKHADLKPSAREKINFMKSRGRILAEDLAAPVDLPPFSRSTVDGFAVMAGDTSGASESLPVYLTVTGEVLMGEKTELQIGPGQAVKIPTGGMLPRGADAVLMVEYTDYLDQQTIETSTALAVGENIIRQGEDIEEGQPLLRKGHQIRPQDIGALAGLGITEIEVYSRPKIAVISTGDELVPPETEPAPGEIRDINSYSLAALLEEAGCVVQLVGIVEDSFSGLESAVKKYLDSDLILISGGSSVGVKDVTIDVLNSIGNPGVLLHGVAIKPGKPTILSVIEGVPVLGLPGHPASAWTIAQTLILPLVKKLRGKVDVQGDGRKEYSIDAFLTRNLVSDKGREEYVPVRLVEDLQSGKETYLAEPILGKSGLITTLVEADGFIRIATYQEGKNQGERVGVRLFK